MSYCLRIKNDITNIFDNFLCIGDLKGIESRLDYLAQIGIEAVWISPFFTSPMKDFGYDISDFTDIDPIFGTLDDFKSLLTLAHERNLTIVLDFVLLGPSRLTGHNLLITACRACLQSSSSGCLNRQLQI